MFYDQYQTIIDSKNRLPVPVAFRKAAEQKDGEPATFFVTLGFDKCLFMFTVSEWQRIETLFKQGTPLNNERNRRLQRTFFGNAAKCVCDKRGRIVLPAHLIAKGGLKKEGQVTVVGISNRIEVWDRDRWQQHDEINVREYDSLSDVLKDIGL